MSDQNYYEGISHTVCLKSTILKLCEHCDEHIGPPDNDIAHDINHYLSKHGYKLLHVGQEWAEDEEGKSTHVTVAIVGR
jgi:hypothetical protein